MTPDLFAEIPFNLASEVARDSGAKPQPEPTAELFTLSAILSTPPTSLDRFNSNSK